MWYNMCVQFWVALQSLPQGMSATLPPLQGDKPNWRTLEHLMKTILVLSILFSVVALPVLGELTVEDIEKIDQKIQASETRMKEHVTQQVNSLKTPVAWLIGILVALIALIGIPLVVLTIMMGWRSVKDNSQEKINQELREEIETLKQQRMVP